MISGADLAAMVSRSWWSLLLALCAGMAVAVLFGMPALEAGRSNGASLEEESLGQASEFAFAWGRESDAATLLGQRAERLGKAAADANSVHAYELALVRFRRAIVEGRSESEMRELCKVTPKCSSDRLAELVAKIAAKRNVGVLR